MFLQIQFVLHIFAKQVSNLFIVDLQVRSMDEIFDTDGHLNCLKNMIKGPEQQQVVRITATVYTWNKRWQNTVKLKKS